jgi:hypothetical protein
MFEALLVTLAVTLFPLACGAPAVLVLVVADAFDTCRGRDTILRRVLRGERLVCPESLALERKGK